MTDEVVVMFTIDRECARRIADAFVASAGLAISLASAFGDGEWTAAVADQSAEVMIVVDALNAAIGA